MATITEDYVSFETAKLLKEKGFQAKCTACYRNDLANTFELISGRINYCNPRFKKYKSIPPYNAPTLQMAMKWLRKVHNIDCTPYLLLDKGLYTYMVIQIKPINVLKLCHENYDSHEKASEAAIKYCLENLI